MWSLYMYYENKSIYYHPWILPLCNTYYTKLCDVFAVKKSLDNGFITDTMYPT